MISFMQCSCENDRHYCWCLHSALWARARPALSDITGPPPTLDPAPLESVKRRADGSRKPISRVGRPAAAVSGAPLATV